MPADRLTVPALVRRWAAERPDTEFVVTQEERITFAELDARTRALAAQIRRARCREGHASRIV